MANDGVRVSGRKRSAAERPDTASTDGGAVGFDPRGGFLSALGGGGTSEPRKGTHVLIDRMETVKTALIGGLIGLIGGALISMHMGLTTWQNAAARYANVSINASGPDLTPAPVPKAHP